MGTIKNALSPGRIIGTPLQILSYLGCWQVGQDEGLHELGNAANRLDARIPFQSLGPKVMANIVDKFIAELCDQLRPKKVTLKLTPSAREYLVEQGFDPANGARPLARLIEREIKVPLSDHLLFGALAQGGLATVRVQKGALLVEVASR